MGRQADTGPITLDSGALIAIEGGKRKMAVILQRARDLRASFIVPTGVLAQTWRGGPRQARLAAFLKSRDVRVEDLNAVSARAVGELCGRSGASDVIDASVVLTARRYGGLVVTGDQSDLLSIDPTLRVAEV